MTALPTQPRKIQSRPEAPFVLPKPPQRVCELIVGQDSVGAATLRRQLAALPALGERLEALLGCQDQFLAELRLLLEDRAAGTSGSDTAAATAVHLLDWCEAVQQDVALEAERAAAGQQMVDLLDLCHDVQHDLRRDSSVASVDVHGHARQAVWGCVASLERLLRLGVQLVAQRAGQQESVFFEVGDGPVGPEVRICASVAGPGSMDSELVEGFCELASETQVEVHPDEDREGVIGILLVIPSRPRMASSGSMATDNL